jgi:pimeloyl-ACP methyl ester carboxylesterase
VKITVDGRSVHVTEAGAGPPVIFVHASTLTSGQWARYTPRLSQRHRVLAPDLLGYGRSDPWPDPDRFALAEDAAIVSALLEETQGAHLVGHSYGGLIALLAAKDAPALVRSIALYEPVAFGVLHSGRHEAGIADLATEDFFLDATTGGDERWMRAFIDYWNGPGAYDLLPPPRRAPVLAAGRKTFLEVRELLRDRTPHTAYRVLDAPALLIRGTTSPVAGRAVAEILAATLPRARPLVTLDGAGHMAPLLEIDRVATPIVDFLSSVL